MKLNHRWLACLDTCDPVTVSDRQTLACRQQKDQQSAIEAFLQDISSTPVASSCWALPRPAACSDSHTRPVYKKSSPSRQRPRAAQRFLSVNLSSKACYLPASLKIMLVISNIGFGLEQLLSRMEAPLTRTALKGHAASGTAICYRRLNTPSRSA
jgi:hypothetical protein